MSLTSRIVTMKAERADRILEIVERVVKGREGIWVRLHSFVVASAMGISLSIGKHPEAISPFVTATAPFWSAGAAIIAALQLLAIATDQVNDRAIAGNAAGIFFGSIAFVSIYQEPLSFVGHCLLSLAFWCLMPAIKGLFD